MTISAPGSNTSTAIIGKTDTEVAAKNNRNRDAAAVDVSKSDQSSVVTLSKEAQGFAELASKGITAFTIKDGARTLQALLNRGSGMDDGRPHGVGGNISIADFNEIMSQLGASEAQLEHLRQSFDTNGDGSITSEEMLHGFASTLDTGSADSQLILGLMDRSGNSDGIVQQAEYMDVQTALVYAQKK